jgi:hypothetical protein
MMNVNYGKVETDHKLSQQRIAEIADKEMWKNGVFHFVLSPIELEYFNLSLCYAMRRCCGRLNFNNDIR